MAGGIAIDQYGGNTSDTAEFEGHLYSDKAPGTVVVAVPAFTLGALLLRAMGQDLDSAFGWLLSSWIACVGSVGTVAGLGMAAMFFWLAKRVAPAEAFFTSLATFLGAAPLPYATMMFSHSLVVGLIAIAVWAAERQGRCAPGRPRCGFLAWFRANRWDLLTGFVCGWALASEYTAGLVIAGLFVWVTSQGWRRAVPFCLAAFPAVLLIPFYSWLCFGKPFTLPYSLNTTFPEMKEGLYAIGWPDPETAFNLLFSPARGLFFWSPFLLMAAVGYRTLMRIDSRLFWLTYAVPVVQIAVIAGRTWDWPAGPTLGPRYLAPILPLLALPSALGVQRLPKTGLLLGGYSVAITTLATLINASPPYNGYPNPLLDLHLPMLMRGELAPNLGTLVGLPPFASVALFYALLIAAVCWVWHELPMKQVVRDVSFEVR
jgi:hypothetical protein